MGDERAKANVKYVNDIIKSCEDKRLYKGLILPNQLRVLLISDPETDKSAASLSVGVGQLSDPDDLPGLAHFCEHMLFMGSKKYPCENDYNKFLTEHGGSSNAFTSLDKTLYFFDVASEHLEGALDRLAQFFLCPLMSESAVEREVNAVNSEHEKNIANDSWRFYQLKKSFSKDGHPYSKFGTGNKTTLFILPQEKGINTREELLKFHEIWYSANIMSLVVLGKESLEDLEKMTVELFSEVENKSVVRPEWRDHPFGPDQLQTKVNVVPVKDLKELIISFPTPDLSEYYKAKPAKYMRDLVGHEGPGSLLSILKTKNWANSLSASDERAAKGFSFFSICIDLTDDGIEKIDEIITLIFEYLNTLKTSGTQEWIFEEKKRISKIYFQFQNKQNPADYVVQLASDLQNYDYPLKEMLVGPYLLEKWRPDLIEMLLSDYLKPANVQVTVVGQKFDSIADETEPWYGTKYKLRKIPEDVIRKWENCGVNDALKLPDPNEFIPSNFDILFIGENGNKPRHPLIVHESNFIRVWLKQDDEFLLPKAELKISFISPIAFFDPLSYSITNIFIDLLKDTLNEYTYYARLTGLSYSIGITYYGFVLNMSGYNDKQKVLLDAILAKMTDFKVDRQRFEVLKEKFIRDLKNFKASEPFEQVSHYLCWLLEEKSWTEEELLEITEQMTAENVDEFVPRFLSKLYVECLIHGNVNKERSNSLIQIIESRLISKLSLPLLPKELLLYREILLNDEEYFVQEIPNEFHKSSCIDNYYQCCELSTENNVLTDLLIQILKEPAFDILRTKEQLGYIVLSRVRRSNSVQGLRIIVQSDKHPNFIDQRIEAFLIRIREVIEDMSEEEFERNKEALEAKRLEKPKKLSKLTAKFWDEIFFRQYNFNRDEIEVEYLRKISKNELIKFFDEYIKNGAPKRRKLSVHVISQAEGGAGTLPDTDLESSSLYGGPKKIKDVSKFKRSHGLYPLTEPYVDIAVFKAYENMEKEIKN